MAVLLQQGVDISPNGVHVLERYSCYRTVPFQIETGRSSGSQSTWTGNGAVEKQAFLVLISQGNQCSGHEKL